MSTEFKNYTKAFWILFSSTVLLLSIGLMLISYGWFGPLPSFDELENPKSSLATEVFTSDGQLLGKYFFQNRSYARFEEISPEVINALIATEDIRFYDHSGIDIRGLARAVFFLGKKGGASTISQQLAKNLFHGQGSHNKVSRVIQKLQEWIIALQLERRYSKHELISMYLNTVDFGYNAFGIKSAAKTYFNKPAQQLNVNEAAVLIGLLKGTSIYSPIKNPENALARRNTVITQMVKYDFVESVKGEKFKKLPLKLDFRKQSHTTGLATYFRENLRQELIRWCDNNLKADGANYNIYKDGLKVYTTIDSRMQTYAENAVETYMPELQKSFYDHWRGKGNPWGNFNEVLDNSMRRTSSYQELKRNGKSIEEIKSYFNKPMKMTLFSWNGPIDTICSLMDSIKYAKHFLHTGFMAMDPKNGHVKAWVGGINMDFSQYDHVNVSAKRQVGSTFKPFVYTVAIDNGIAPCTQIPNQPVVFPDFDNWSPSNYDGKNGGSLNLFQGLAMSINNIVAYLIKQVGPQAVIDLCRKLGVVSKLEPYPALCLGTYDMSVSEMVGAYGVYANKGIYNKPIYLTRIEDKNGVVLQEFNAESNEALSEETAYVMTKLMQGVVDKGTATRLRFRYGFRHPFAGKTGTTQNNSDGWFLGYSPEIVVGCWTGADDRSVHFRTTHLGGGANVALPTVSIFLTKVYADKSLGFKGLDFEAPEAPLKTVLNCSQYVEPGAAETKTESVF